MANIKSAKKRVLVNAKSAAHNKSIRSDLRTALKKANLALENNDENKAELVKAAIIKLDSASAKGIIHSNNAARNKSHLQQKLNKLS